MWHRKGVTEKFVEGFDEDKLEPLFYCKKHWRLEDGAHRLAAAPLLGIKALDIAVGNRCFRLQPEYDLIPFFCRRMKRRKMLEKDFKWLYACRDLKWAHLDNIDFSGKTVLDIGCQVGYSILRAMQYGARSGYGIDIRPKVIWIAQMMTHFLKLREQVKFECASIVDYETEESFDIVFCMGLLHYLDSEIYETILRKIAQMCSDTLILEMRLSTFAESFIHTVAMNQSLPTIIWFEGKLREFGFEIQGRFPIKKGKREQRELWIARRIKR